MIERTIVCDFDNGEKAYIVMPDADGKTIHIVRGTVHETFININPNASYEVIEYGVKFFDENIKRDNLVRVAHDEIYRTPEAAIYWGADGPARATGGDGVKVDTWPAEVIESIPSKFLKR